MKVKILAGLVTAFIYGGAAMAQDVSNDQSNNQSNTQGQQSPDNMGGSGLEQSNPNDLIILDQQDVAPVPSTGAQEQGVGGSGQASTAPQGVQSGIPIQGQGGVTLYCTPVNQQAATGGAGLNEGLSSNQGFNQGLNEDEWSAKKKKKGTKREEAGYGGSGYEQEKKKGEHLRGVGVTIGGGVEGYTGSLASNVDPGAAAGVTVALRPSSVLGFEVGYSGALNEIDRRFGAGGAGTGGSGPDIVRNGGNAALTLGLAATPVQPYVLGGIGVSRYNIRNGGALGFRDDTVGNVPVGVGLRTQIGAFTADLRGDYNFLFSNDFAPPEVTTNAGSGRYQGTLNIGGTF